ncbi:MAG TPA: MinD/ParA family protein [Actinomycetes bacterium]|jgi:MinD-like ATPase involved in chromosome partitioning or flagellar assembly|nr:MinD/ParA family protein [Actinomycetes bacterium]
MSAQDPSPVRRDSLFGSPFDDDLDGWHDAPEPSWLAQEEDPAAGAEVAVDEAGSSHVPSYDLGPQTESFVLDLTGPVPTYESAEAVYAPASEAAPEPPPLDELFDPVSTGSRHAAPEAEPSAYLPAAPPEPSTADVPGVAQVPQAPAAATPPPPSPVLRRDPVSLPAFHIPPVAEGTGRNQSESLTAATVLRARKARPQSGWRKRVLSMTGGKVNFGLSPADRRRAEMLTRTRTPIAGCHRVAVISLKGGVGKTTTTAALGAMFANLRGDRVIAVDANPDRGTLIERVPRESGATVRHLLEARDQVTRYGDIRAFTSQSPTRLEVLASDSDPGASSALSEQNYRDTVDTLERFYNLILTDCGTGLLHDAMRGVLGLASSLVVVSSASLDGARSASATLDWLEAHGMAELARDAVVVISSVRPGGGIVDVMQLEDHFAARCRAVVTIPYDPHLEAGGVLDVDELDEETLHAYRELAAAVGEGFALHTRVGLTDV